MSLEEEVTLLGIAVNKLTAAISEQNTLIGLDMKYRYGEPDKNLEEKPVKKLEEKPKAAKPGPAEEVTMRGKAEPEKVKPTGDDLLAEPPETTFTQLSEVFVKLVGKDYNTAADICKREGVAKISGLDKGRYKAVYDETVALLAE